MWGFLQRMAVPPSKGGGFTVHAGERGEGGVKGRGVLWWPPSGGCLQQQGQHAECIRILYSYRCIVVAMWHIVLVCQHIECSC